MGRILMIAAAGPLFGLAVLASAQDGAAKDETVHDFRDYLGYDPSPAYPNGRPHPDAPPELSQFAFFIGEFDCIDRQRGADGEWREFPAIWNASYFLNGFGIQDKYYAQGFQTSNIRLYDAREGVWKVTFFYAPGYNSGVWTGGKQADDIILDQASETAEGEKSISRLTFFEISQAGFEWHAETIKGAAAPVKGWTSSCKRRGGQQD